jgi:hypothetical protein
MPDAPLYVIVHTRANERSDRFRATVYDVVPDGSLDDIRERAANLQGPVASYGRPDDTYRVAELRYVDEEA